jgi:cytochrome b
MQTDTVKVWDPLVRVFHWSLVLFFFTAYLTAEELDTVHAWSGYAVLGLVAFRLVWGLIGTRHARFTDFVRSPSAVIAYLKDLIAFRARRYIGHNPAGGLMIVALLISLVITGITGLMVYGAHDQAGPLAASMAGIGHDTGEGLEEVHEFFGNFTLFLVALHILGVVVSGKLHGENLVRAMITGRKAREV